MNDIINQLMGLASMLALYGSLWLANMFFGIANSLKSGGQWDWHRFFSGWRTAALGAVGLVFAIGSILFIPIVFSYNNITISEEWQSAISLLAIIAGLAGGILTYAKRVVAGIAQFTNPESVEMKLTPDVNNWNMGSIETKTGNKTDQQIEEEGKK